MNNKKRSKILSWVMTFLMIAVSVMGNIGVAFAEEATASDLFISEYIEGSGSNKAIEIFNGTGKDVDLSEYKLELYSNGSSVVSKQCALIGSFKNGEVYVVANSGAVQTIKDKAQKFNNDVVNFNGDDAIVLKHNDVIIDCFGKVGEDPGSSWGKADYTTADHTLVRNSTITKGDSVIDDSFDPSVEWSSYPKDTTDYLGTHTMGETTEPIVLKALTLPQTAEVEATKSTKLLLNYEPTDTTEKDVEWTSADQDIATVSQDGTVTGKAAGETKITVTSKVHSKITAQCTVKVNEAAPITLVTMAQARALQKGSEVIVEAFVTSLPGCFGDKSFYAQDATAGALVYNKSVETTAVIGNKVKITGKTDEHNGKFEIIPTTIEILSSEVNLPIAKVINIAGIAEANEAEFVNLKEVKVTKVSSDSYKNAYITINDGTNQGTVKLDSRTGSSFEDLKVVENDTISVVGVIEQSKVDEYRVLIRDLNDITKAEVGPDETAPVIEHTSIPEANLNLDLTVSAKVTDDRKVESVKLYYKTKGQVDFKALDMVIDGQNYTYTIPKAELNVAGLEYYIEATDGTNPVKTATYNVNVVNVDIAGPTITKVEPAEGAVLDKTNTKPGIRVEFNDESNIDKKSVKLEVDAVDVSTSATVQDDSVSYTMDTELSQGKHTVIVKVRDTKGNETIKTWNFTIGQVEYNTYFGELHSHTGEISDGSGTLKDAYAWARDNAKADFFAVTDHSNWFDNDTKGRFTNADGTENDCAISTKWTKMHEIADKYNEDGKFAAIAGFEMTWSGSTGGWGHINTFNTKGFETRSNKDVDLKSYYDKISQLPNSISQLNHPGKTFGDFADFGYYSKAADEVINLIEVGNGEGLVRGSGYFPSYDYYTRALDKGWHVAPTNNEDNHKGNWVNSNTARTVVLAPTLTRESIYDAMSNKRVYSTEDENLEIMYKVNDKVMGAFLDNPEKLDIVIDIKDPDATDKIGKVSIIANGGTVVATKTIDSNSGTWTLSIDPKYNYYYVRVDEVDKDIAVTAPVWTGEATPVGMGKVESSQNITVVNEPIEISAEVYNNKELLTLENVNVEFYEKQISDESKIGEATIASIETGKVGTAKFNWTPKRPGNYTIYAKAVVTLDGREKAITGSVKVTVMNKEDIVKVVVDGGHQNQYVTGNYSGKIGALTQMLSDKNCMVVVNKDELTAEDLKGTKLLIITDPQSKDDTKYNVLKSVYNDAEVAVIKAFVENGGNLILTSKADYGDGEGEYSNGVQGNKILEAIGTNLRINDDEVVDNTTNGGQPFRLAFNKYTSSKYGLTENIPDGQTYSFYSGCSVILKDGADASKVDYVVMGHDTTETIDSDNQKDSTAVQKGNVNVLAAEELANGAKIVVAGSTFFSDFEMTGDNPNSNIQIAQNVMDWMAPQAPVEFKTIKEVRVDADNNGEPDLLTKKFAIEGYVTAQSEAVTPKNAFFEVIYVQDATAGITVFGVSTTAVKLGQKVRVTGYVDQYGGDAEIQIVDETKDLQIIDEAINIVEPKLISSKDSMLEENEGLLVKIKGIVTKMNSQNLYINDGTGEARAYVEGYIGDGSEANKGKWDASIKVGDAVSIVGLASEDPEGHRLRVRNTSEIIKRNLEIERLSSDSEFNVGKAYEIVIKATNKSKETEKVVLIIGQYDKNGKLLDYVKDEKDINGGEIQQLQKEFTIVPNTEYVKYFVWDSMNGMNPYVDAVKIPVK